MNAAAATTPTVSRVENRDAIANPNRVECYQYYTARRRQVSLPAARVSTCLLLFFVHDLVVGINHVVRSLRVRVRAGSCRFVRGRGAFALLALRIQRLTSLAVHPAQLFLSAANLAQVVRAERLAGPLDRRLELGFQLGAELVGPLLRVLLDLVREAVETVSRVDLLALALVGIRIRFGVLQHLLDVVLRETTRRLDPDLLLLPGRLVFRGHVQNAVRVDVEGHLDLRHATLCGWNSGELEFADGLVPAGELALTLQHVDLDRRLVVLGRREHFRLLGWDGRVPRNEHRGHAAQRLDTE